MLDYLASLPSKLLALATTGAVLIAALRGPPRGPSAQRLSPPYQLEFDFLRDQQRKGGR